MRKCINKQIYSLLPQKAGLQMSAHRPCLLLVLFSAIGPGCRESAGRHPLVTLCRGQDGLGSRTGHPNALTSRLAARGGTSTSEWGCFC